MENILRVTFLGDGAVFINDAPVGFPYTKAWLLFLAVAEAGSISREKLCRAFWGDTSAKSRASLRNALSAIRRALPEGCVATDRGEVRMLVEIESDLDRLNPGSMDRSSVSRLSTPFLNGVDPNCAKNRWVRDRRDHYSKVLRDVLAQKAELCEPEEKNFWLARLSSLDGSAALGNRRVSASALPFVRTAERDEIVSFFDDGASDALSRPCLCSMIVGEEGSGKSALALAVYGEMEKMGACCLRGRVLEGEVYDCRSALGDILNELASHRSSPGEPMPQLYAGYLEASFDGFSVRGQGAKNSKKRNALHSQTFMDLNPYLLGKIFALLFDQYDERTKTQPVFFLLEDAHWGERWVPYFLKGLFENAEHPIFVLLTSYPEFATNLDITLSAMAARRALKKIFLSRLTLEQTAKICGEVLPAHRLTPEKISDIYAHTDGSPFLLKEFLSFCDDENWSTKLTGSLEDVVHSRILSLSEEESDVLDCVAVFKNDAPYDFLKYLTGLDDTALTRICGRLHKKGLVYDRASESNYSIFFRYSLIKKQIRESMPNLKRWNLYRRMLEYHSTHSEPWLDRRELLEVARQAGDHMTGLEVLVSELKAHLDFNHELFPKLSDDELSRQQYTLNDTCLTKNYLAEAEGLLDELVRARGRTPQLIRLERELLTLSGGYMRWEGDYASADSFLREALRMAFHERDNEAAVSEVLEQMCYMGIQKDDPELLRRYVFLLYRSAMKTGECPTIGMALRFIAILKIMEGEYDAADKLLKMSIRLFERLEAYGKSYMLSIIGAIHYKGDIALHRGRHEEAIAHYLDCVKLSQGKGFHRGLGLHLAKAAWCAIRLERLDEARRYLAFARPLLEGFESRIGAGLCGGEIVFGLSALFNIWDGEPQKAVGNMLGAQKLGGIMRKPLWSAILSSVKALMKASGEPSLDAVLTHDLPYYIKKTEQLFEALGLSCETEVLKIFMGPVPGTPDSERPAASA